MAWRVDRFNKIRNETETAPESFNTGVEAFDKAWDNAGTFIKNAIRQTEFGNDESPPGPSHRFKVYVEYRATQQVGLELRYDYPTGTPPNNLPEGTWETNSIFWHIREE